MAVRGLVVQSAARDGARGGEGKGKGKGKSRSRRRPELHRRLLLNGNATFPAFTNGTIFGTDVANPPKNVSTVAVPVDWTRLASSSDS
jgi:hypothetical protein